ncbi:hypothetical protein [Pseudorhodoplanes sp.]|uniref:hypothetical protein n=1 Tax=Pseudorhodoplanes sp. TaxID=1934341 RepID=UPI003D13C681
MLLSISRPIWERPGREHVANSIGRPADIFSSVNDAIAYHHADRSDPQQRRRLESFLERVDGGYQFKRDLHSRDQFKQVLDFVPALPCGPPLSAM